MKRLISMFIAVAITLTSVVLPVYAAEAVTSGTYIENLIFSDDTKLLSWDSLGTEYVGANVYKYNADGSIQLLGYTEEKQYTYPEEGTYIVRPVLSNNTMLEGKVITTVAPENLINISKIHLSQQGVYTISVENITGHYIRCNAVVDFLDENDEIIKYSYGKAFIEPNGSNEFKFLLKKPKGTERTAVNVYDDLGNCLANLESDVYHRSVIEENRKNVAEIRSLLAQCKIEGISTDYETVNYKVMERFNTYLQEDLNNDKFDNSYYLGSVLDELYIEAKENLTAYLAGEKEPRKVPKYITSDMRIDGDSVYAMTELDGVTEERPVFFVGYGHFDTAANDMPLFNEIGANTIQTEIGPTDVMTFADDGSYTIKTDKIEKLKTILENAEENNIAVSVLLSPHYFPTNVIEYYDIGHSDGATEFLKYNVNADIAKTIIEAYLRYVVPEIKDYTSLNNICLSNEPFFKPESCGDFYKDEWAQFLEEKYGSTWNLYQAYGKYYLTFSRVPLDASGSDAKEYDYKLFNDMIFSRWHKWMAEIINELAPDVPLHSKIMAYVDDDDIAARMKRGVGYDSYYDFLDLNGCDAHNYINDGSGLYQVNDGYHVESMWYDYMRSIKDAPVINSEDHIIPDRSTNYTDQVADYVAQNMYMGAIHGRAISDIWVWERTYDESSDFAGSVLQRPDVIAAIGKETLNLNRNAYEITALQNADKEVGILYSDSSILSDTSTSFALYQTYAACLYSGKAVQFVTPTQLSKMNNCKVLIVPQATYVTSETLDYIKSFIENGGKVMIIGQNSLKKNEKNENNDSDTLDYIINNSYVLNYNGTNNSTGSMTQAQLYDEIRTVLSDANIYNVIIKDAESGETVDYVEYNVGTYNGKTIINMISYEEDKNVNIYIGGNLVASSYDINNCVELSEDISLKRYVPVTVRISAN